MPSTIEFKDYVLDNLRGLHSVTCKPMMGEYLLYYNGVLFGGIYDDRLLIKITNYNQVYRLSQDIPYDKAKPMYIVDNLDDIEYLARLIKDTCKGLKRPS